MNIQKIDINKLNPASYNPRKNLKPEDREYQKIKRSIQEFGYIEPIIVNSDFTIIGGHQRYKILREQGIKEAEVVIVEVDKAKEKAMNIALNKAQGEWDMEALESLLEELREEDFDFEITGFDDEDIDDFFKDAGEVLDLNDNKKSKEKSNTCICPKCGFEWMI